MAQPSINAERMFTQVFAESKNAEILLPVIFEKAQSNEKKSFVIIIAATGGITEYIIIIIPEIPVMLFMYPTEDKTVRRLSLISPPAIGIRRAVPKRMPFIAIVSAALLRAVCKLKIPDKRVKESPVIHRTMDFKEFDMPVKFISLHKTFIVFVVNIILIMGRAREEHISSIAEIEKLPAVDTQAEERGEPCAAYSAV